jgi:hypothetical protein
MTPAANGGTVARRVGCAKVYAARWTVGRWQWTRTVKAYAPGRRERLVYASGGATFHRTLAGRMAGGN